ncbi:MAG: GNAT family N-acetyltransferase [Candidatus Woesearchaeota archaeon]
MEEIIKLNRRYVDQLAEVDFESEHPVDAQRNLSKAKMKRYISLRFDEGKEIFFGLKKDKELIGYITLKPFFPGWKHCEIYWLAVKKKFQRQEFGKKLVWYLEDYARKKGFRKTCLYTGKDMKDAQKFYQKMGYKYVNEFPCFYGFETGNTTAVLLSKELSQ